MHSAINVGALQEAGTLRYTIDAAASKFSVKVFAGGWLSAFGHDPEIAIRTFSGEAEFDPKVMERSSLILRIDAESLAVVSKASDRDRGEIERMMREEVLMSNSYSEIVYECRQVTVSGTSEGRYWVALNGELTLLGNTRRQPVPATVSVTDLGLRATGNFSLKQTDYGIKPVSAMGGGLVVKDEIKFSFDIAMRKA